MSETRPSSVALVEGALANSSDPMTAQEIAEQTRVATTTVWSGINALRDSGAVVPVDTQPFRWRPTPEIDVPVPDESVTATKDEPGEHE